MTSEARAAADLASEFPIDHPLARAAREVLESLATEGQHMTTQIGTQLRDAAVDPRPGDFMPTVEVSGHPGVLRHLEVDEPGYAAAVAAHKEEFNG